MVNEQQTPTGYRGSRDEEYHDIFMWKSEIMRSEEEGGVI